MQIINHKYLLVILTVITFSINIFSQNNYYSGTHGLNETQSAGNYRIKFNASQLNSGVFFYTLNSGIFSKTMKMTILK